jgi:hypothetical protein
LTTFLSLTAADRIQKLRVAATTTTAKANSAATLARMRVVRHSRSIFGVRSGVFTGLSLVIAGVEILARGRFLRGESSSSAPGLIPVREIDAGES